MIKIIIHSQLLPLKMTYSSKERLYTYYLKHLGRPLIKIQTIYHLL